MITIASFSTIEPFHLIVGNINKLYRCATLFFIRTIIIMKKVSIDFQIKRPRRKTRAKWKSADQNLWWYLWSFYFVYFCVIPSHNIMNFQDIHCAWNIPYWFNIGQVRFSFVLWEWKQKEFPKFKKCKKKKSSNASKWVWEVFEESMEILLKLLL